MDAFYKLMSFITGKVLNEIRRDPFAQILGLAYIQQSITLVVVLVNAGLLRNGRSQLLKLICGHVGAFTACRCSS